MTLKHAKRCYYFAGGDRVENDTPDDEEWEAIRQEMTKLLTATKPKQANAIIGWWSCWDRRYTSHSFAKHVREEYARITGKEPEKAAEAQETLKPCPLCGGEAEHTPRRGIQCQKCLLWMGDNMNDYLEKNGGYVKIWNSRK